MRSLKLVLVTLVGVLAVGCASVPRQSFNKEAAAGIKSVAVSQRAEDETYDVNIVAHPGVNFGLIGGLIAAADLSSKSSRLTAALDPKQTDLQSRIARQVTDALKTAGYETQVVPVSKGVDAAHAYDSLKPELKVDALLALDVTGMYVAAGPNSDYVPFVRVKVLEKDAATGKVLYEDTMTYGYSFEHSETVHLRANEKFRFKDIDALVADPLLAREGLFAGVDAITAQIASDLKR